MALLDLIRQNWIPVYAGIGFAIFLFLAFSKNVPDAGWNELGSGKRLSTGGYLWTFWTCVFFWLPALCVLLIHAVLTQKARQNLQIGFLYLCVAVMFLWPVAFVAVIVFQHFGHK